MAKYPYTPEQLQKLKAALEELEMNTESAEDVLESNILSDVFSRHANISNRAAIREALGLGVLPYSEPGRHVVNYNLSTKKMMSPCKFGFVASHRFCIDGQGEVEFEHCLFKFESYLFPRELRDLIVASDPDNPWENAKNENMFSYLAQNPEADWIYCLGEKYGVPFAYTDDTCRKYSYSYWEDCHFNDDASILAVRRVIKAQ